MIDYIKNSIVWIIGKINWGWLVECFRGNYFEVTGSEQEEIKKRLRDHYYIILTRRKTHLSTYAINFSHLLLTHKCCGYYSHALMNLEDEVKTDDDFRLMEATGSTGVHYAKFDEVFDCDSVVLLKPKNLSLDEWTAVLDKAKQQEGKKYDTLYDLHEDQKLSCVELVRVALQSEPNYSTDFANFEAMVQKYKNLEPHMFYECPDFEVVYETRH